MGERHQPAARARDLDEPPALGQGGAQLIVGDQGYRRHRPQQGARLRGQPSLLQDGAQHGQGLRGRHVPEQHPHRRGHPPQFERRAPGRALARVAARLPDRRCLHPGVAGQLRLQPFAQLGWIRPGLLERLTAQPGGRVEAAAQPEGTGPAERDRPALNSGGGLDRLVQEVEGIRLHVRGQREAELEPDVRVPGRIGRRLGGRAAQVGRRALRSAPPAGPPGRFTQHRDRRRLAGWLRAQQVQGDALRVGALRGQQGSGVGVPERPLALGQARVQRSRDQRVREHQPRAVLEQAGCPQCVRSAGRPGEIEPGQPGGMAQRRAGTEDGDGAGQRPGAVRQPRELALDNPRDLLGPERSQSRGGLVVRPDVVGGELGEQGAEQERVAAGDGMTRVGEPGAGRGQALAHERFRRRGPERPGAHGRVGRAGQELGQQVGRGGGLTRADRADHADPQLAEGARQQRQPAQRRRVGPVDVVDDERGRAALAEVAGQPDEPARGGVHRVTRQHRLLRPGAEGALGQPRGADRELVPARAGPERLEELAGHPPGGVLFEGAAAGPEHRHAVHSSRPAHGREQRGLADAGRALDHDHATRS